jgi:protein-S-isoprenylcysteine O-methyltransferase Ste14
LRIFLIFVWFLCCGYSTIPLFWFAAHPFAGFWRRQRRSPYYALLPIWAAMIAATCVITWRWRYARLYDTAWAWIPGVIVLLLGIRVYRLAHQGFSDAQIMGRPELEGNQAEQCLVASGIRSRMRHPIYLGHLLEMIGWALGSGLTVVWVLIGWAVLTGALMIRIEERELDSRFGKQYRKYKSNVPALSLSFVGKKNRSADEVATCLEHFAGIGGVAGWEVDDFSIPILDKSLDDIRKRFVQLGVPGTFDFEENHGREVLLQMAAKLREQNDTPSML